jgi:cephalosporin hydroxylase
MVITIDTGKASVRVADDTGVQEYELFSPAAFRILSRQWLSLGWNLHHSFTFSFMGRHFIQLPDDMLRLGELIWRLRPDLIIETGVYDGGSSLFLATLCRMGRHGRIVSIEKNFRPGVREAVLEIAGDIVTFIEGDSSSPEIAARVSQEIRADERVCVFLDSDHTAKHVAAELDHLGGFVSPGCYVVVADSNMPDMAHTPRGRAAWAHLLDQPDGTLSDSPARAVDQFLAVHPEFRRERPVPLFAEEQFDFSELSYFEHTWLKRCEAFPGP